MDCYTYIESNGSIFWACGIGMIHLGKYDRYDPDLLSGKSKHKFDAFDDPDYSWYKHYFAEAEFPAS